MNLLRTITVLLPLALTIPAAYAQTRDTASVTTHPVQVTPSDDLLASTPVPQTLPRVPWAATPSAGSDPIVAAPQAAFVFADEVPLQAGMFDSPTAWEDEP